MAESLTSSVAPKLSWKLPDWFKDIPESQLNVFKKYHEELVRSNDALSLVSQKTLVYSDIIHFSDSILSSRLIYKDQPNKPIADLGSGNGFPGLVYAILYPEVQVTLVDQDAAKLDYLKHLSGILKLKNVMFAKEAVENIKPGSYPLAMCRGLASIAKGGLMFRKGFVKGSAIYMMKSEEWSAEIVQLPAQLCRFWDPVLLGEYRLPVGEVKFAVIKMKKVAD